jgi:flagellar motor switch protein FliM
VVGDEQIGTAAVGTAGARLACVVTATIPDPSTASDPASEESA